MWLLRGVSMLIWLALFAATSCFVPTRTSSPDGHWRYTDVSGNTWSGEYFYSKRAWMGIAVTNDGVLTRYDPNGNKVEEGAYRKGQQEGPWAEWNSTGAIDCEGNYVNGLKQGAWVHWGMDGKKRDEQWDMGKRHGLWTFWSPTQQLLHVTGQYPDGTFRCESIRRCQEPRILYQVLFDHGRLVGKWEGGITNSPSTAPEVHQ